MVMRLAFESRSELLVDFFSSDSEILRLDTGVLSLSKLSRFNMS